VMSCLVRAGGRIENVVMPCIVHAHAGGEYAVMSCILLHLVSMTLRCYDA
jgi:hypothetical protein